MMFRAARQDSRSQLAPRYGSMVRAAMRSTSFPISMAGTRDSIWRSSRATENRAQLRFRALATARLDLLRMRPELDRWCASLRRAPARSSPPCGRSADAIPLLHRRADRAATRSSATARSAPSRSALFTTNTSAISITPALSACTSSPMPGTSTSTETSAVRAISTSSCPTPTVSIATTSFPAASSTRAASVVARARPPRCPRVAMLRMNTPASCACACMRTRSPSMAPPLNGLVGSTARTPTVWPALRQRETRPSTSVLLPAPGAPVMPTRNARPDRPNSSRTSAGPSSASFSTSEMPRAMPRGSPDTIESARARQPAEFITDGEDWYNAAP